MYMYMYIIEFLAISKICSLQWISGLPPTEVVPMHFQRSDSIVGSPAKPFLIGRSRLETEFEELEVLGSGGFGDVIKVGWNDVMVVMS